jgi:uncharacterized RDD family membrane protein YckC
MSNEYRQLTEGETTQLENNSEDLKRKQEWHALKEKLELESQKIFTEDKNTHVPGAPFTEEQASHSSFGSETGTRSYGGSPHHLQNAGVWLRFLALVIDTLIFALAGIILGFILGIMGGSPKSLDIPLFIVGWLYYALLESSAKQATIGKMVLGISVTDLSGNRISFGRATGRYFAKIISGVILCAGYIMAAFTAKKQALHDIMASTLVIKS